MKIHMEDPHRIAKMQYAVDEMRLEKPWELWQWQTQDMENRWIDLTYEPNWLPILSFRRKDGYQLVSPGMIRKPHHHAKAMAEYAKDALKTDTPWELWETNHGFPLIENPSWCPESSYRRKDGSFESKGIEL